MNIDMRHMIDKIRNFNQSINEGDYSKLQAGLKIKFKLKDGSENIGTINKVYSNGVEVKLDNGKFDKERNFVETSLVTMDRIISVIFRGKEYTKEEFFNNFS